MIQFICPFCGKFVTVIESEYKVIHGVPPCKEFAGWDVTKYLHEVNAKLREPLQ